MKKIVAIVIIALIFNSCSESISTNQVVIQGLKNSVFWEAAEYNAQVATGGALKITGTNLDDVLVLSLNSANKGTYTLGSNNAVKGTYSVTQNNILSAFDTTLSRLSEFEPDGIIRGEGKVEITSNDGEKISGKFEFNAVNVDDESDQIYVNFQKGVFNNIPINN